MTHNDPEQAEPRSVKLATDALIDAGNKLSFAAQTSGGTAGRDDALVAAIGSWSKARDKLRSARRIEKYEPDTASPPSHQGLREPTFRRGDRVCKKSGASWNGVVVGEYSSSLTPQGYCVESEREPGSVQLYPAAALQSQPAPSGRNEAATHRDVKRGSEYVLIGFGKMRAERWVEFQKKQHEGAGQYLPWTSNDIASVDMREVAIYRSVDDGLFWMRPKEEFEDGRFVAIAKSQPAPSGETK